MILRLLMFAFFTLLVVAVPGAGLGLLGWLALKPRLEARKARRLAARNARLLAAAEKQRCFSCLKPCTEADCYDKKLGWYHAACYTSLIDSKHRDQINAYKRDYYATHPEARRKGHLRRYNLSPEEYETLLSKQGSACAICKGPHRGRGNRFHVDHDHVTKQVRGLLCGWCNSALGYFEDDVDRLKVAIAYLTTASRSSEQAPAERSLTPTAPKPT